MNEFIIHKGITQVDDMQFHDIEGGFGPGKKAMLVKDIERRTRNENRLRKLPVHEKMV